MGWLEFAIAAGVPVALLVASVVGKSLRSLSFDRRTLYCGEELILASLSGAVLRVWQIVTPALTSESDIDKLDVPPLALAIACAFFSWMFYIGMLKLHQIALPMDRQKTQFVRLGILANGAGLLWLGVVVLFTTRG